MLQKNNKQYSHLSKQIHKTYLTYKPKSFTSKILCNLIIVSLLFVIIILITNEYAYLTDADIKNISAQPTMNKIEIEPWRIVENNSKFKINSNPNISDPIYIPLKNPWGTIYRPNRILCLIPTLWPHRKWKMDLIASTYGPECSKLMWVVDKASNPPTSYAGFEFLIVALTRHQDHRVQHDNRLKNIWEKMHRTWTKIFSIPKYINNYEWFLKADDDSFIVTQNLFGFLQYYDPSYTHYLGHTLRQRWEKENIVFNSGTCYVLSRQALLTIGRYLRYLPSMNPGPPTEHCVDRNGAGEDPSLAACLVGVGIRPSNTLDHELRERFLIFRDTDHVKMYREDTWYWKYAPGGIGQGENCCSPYLISMHNYKTNDSKRIYPMLQKKYNQPKDWSKIILPPRPRFFVWDRVEVDFEIDQYLNIKTPPKGQRIYKGVDKEWICYECDIGNSSDTWWNEWWDETNVTNPSLHINDRYSPYKNQTA